MKSSEICGVVSKFVDDSYFKSLLIDGKWGCGKTYAINNYIKKNKKKKILYLSLFGLESIDEINTSLCLLGQNKIINSLKKCSNFLINKSIKTFLPRININIGLDFQLNTPPSNSKKKLNKCRIIIFDDLERLSNKISYSDFYGYINTLFLSECKIIFLCAENNLDNDRKVDYLKFKEKVIDEVAVINESPNEIINMLLEPYNFKLDEDFYSFFNYNVRKVKRVKGIFEEVRNYILTKKESINNIIFNDELIFKACFYVDELVYKDYTNVNNLKTDFVIYEFYGENIAKGLAYFRSIDETDRDMGKYKFIDLVLAIIDLCIHKNNAKIDELLSLFKEEKKLGLLDKEYYFLSDENKEKYKDEMKKELINNNSFLDCYKTRFFDLLESEKIEFNKSEIQALAKQFFETNRKYSDSDQKLFPLHSTEKLLYYKELIEQVRKILQKIETERYYLDLKKYYNTANYLELNNVIEMLIKNKIIIDSEINKFIIDNEFLMPDLSKDINYNIWSYCNTICRYYKEVNVELLLVYLKNKYILTKSDSEKDRLQQLVFNNIDKNYKLL